MPTSGKSELKSTASKSREPAKEFFYPGKNGRREDANLHNPILENGDVERANKVGRAVALRAGLTQAEVDLLIPPHKPKG